VRVDNAFQKSGKKFEIIVLLSQNNLNRIGVHIGHFGTLRQGFPTWGTCTPRGTFAYLKEYIYFTAAKINFVT